jgi:hypothetical protein
MWLWSWIKRRELYPFQFEIESQEFKPRGFRLKREVRANNYLKQIAYIGGFYEIDTIPGKWVYPCQ